MTGRTLPAGQAQNRWLAVTLLQRKYLSNTSRFACNSVTWITVVVCDGVLAVDQDRHAGMGQKGGR